MDRLVQVVKYGGSILADGEKRPPSLDDLLCQPKNYMREERDIRRVARETLRAWRENSKEQSQLGKPYELWASHGVKQYGHSVVDAIKVIPEVRVYCKFFSDRVVEIFKSEGLPVEQIDLAYTCKWNSKLRFFDVKELLRRGRKVIESGGIPISWGTVVDSIPQGYEIMSGDDHFMYTALLLGARDGIMYLDVPVCDKNPKKYSDAKPLERIKSAEDLLIIVDEVDKTGGLIGKIGKMEMPAIAGTKCQIVDATREGNVYHSLKGNLVGSLVKPVV
jgi:isopentenyl phosphate kinase